MTRDVATGSDNRRAMSIYRAAESTGCMIREMAGCLEKMYPVPGTEKYFLDSPFHRTPA